MKTVIESFKSPSLAGFFVTICDLEVLFHGAPKKIYKGHREVPKLEGARGKNPISLYGQSTPGHKQHWVTSKMYKWSDVISLKANVLLTILRSAATYIKTSLLRTLVKYKNKQTCLFLQACLFLYFTSVLNRLAGIGCCRTKNHQKHIWF
jgi:hypothetical protein